MPFLDKRSRTIADNLTISYFPKSVPKNGAQEMPFLDKRSRTIGPEKEKVCIDRRY